MNFKNHYKLQIVRFSLLLALENLKDELLDSYKNYKDYEKAEKFLKKFFVKANRSIDIFEESK